MDRSKRMFENALNRCTSPLEEDIVQNELKEIGVESIEEYLELMNYKSPDNPWMDLVVDKYATKESDPSDCLRFFCLGRFHEIAMSYKNEIRNPSVKRAPVAVSETVSATECERKRARVCDKGSSISSFVDPPNLSRHIERSEPYHSDVPTPERRKRVIPKIPLEDLIKKADLSNKAQNCLSAIARLFDLAR